MLAEEALFEGAHFAHIAARNEHERRLRRNLDVARISRRVEQMKIEQSYLALREVFA